MNEALNSARSGQIRDAHCARLSRKRDRFSRGRSVSWPTCASRARCPSCCCCSPPMRCGPTARWSSALLLVLVTAVAARAQRHNLAYQPLATGYREFQGTYTIKGYSSFLFYI